MAEKKWLLDFQVQIARHEHILFEQLDLQVAAGEFVYLTGPVGSGKSTLLEDYSPPKFPSQRGRPTSWASTSLASRARSYRSYAVALASSSRTSSSCPTRPCMTTSISCCVPSVSAEVANARASSTRRSRMSALRQRAISIPTNSLAVSSSVSPSPAPHRRPELILADEPTGNLDAENGLAIAELLHRLTKERGTAVIMATHNRQVLEYYPARCIALDTL